MPQEETVLVIRCKKYKMAARHGKPYCKFKPNEPFEVSICLKCKYKRIGVFVILEDKPIHPMTLIHRN